MSIKIEGHHIGHIVGANGRTTTNVFDEATGKKKAQFNGTKRDELVDKAAKWGAGQKFQVSKAASVRREPSRADQEKALAERRRKLDEANQLSADELAGGKTTKSPAELAAIAAEQERIAKQAADEAAAAQAADEAETKKQAGAELAGGKK